MANAQQKVLIVDAEKCTGCEVCDFTCSIVHDGVFQPLHARIRTIRIEPVINMAIGCQFCLDAPCVHACPYKALTKAEDTGIITVDEDACVGCGFCIKSCLFGAISFNLKTEKVQICDLCANRADKPGEPACVEFCPKDAIEYTTLEAFAQKTRKKAVNTLLESIAKQAR
ncbi:MAG: 4Fe-4S dicluster domain-containing protein [Candidatus Helarchaeota archaeon]